MHHSATASEILPLRELWLGIGSLPYKASFSSNARSFLFFSKQRTLGEREEQDFFARDGADVVMHADRLDLGRIENHRLQRRPRCFNQLGPDPLQQVSPFLWREHLDQ